MQEEQNVLTVTQLNRQVRSWLECELGQVTVLGELSNFSRPNSGHFYFTLKDQTAQLRCVYFRNHHDFKSKNLQDGQQVIATGKLSLYEARGDYQLIVQSLSPAGLGELYRQFEQLKIKLQTQGLFAQARKKSLPCFPKLIAVVTSTNGAALRDILTTLKRRFPLAAVKIYGSEVQGKEAVPQLISAINKANTQAQADVMILARGGGSIEDLWAFNDEQLALIISNSTIPIVTGIGHETDFTIADFVADLRAATPTAAAEAVTPNRLDLLNTVLLFEKQLLRNIKQLIQHKQLLLSYQIAKFLSPTQLINRYWQAIDYSTQMLNHSIQTLLHQKQRTLHRLTTQLNHKNPLVLLQHSKAKIQALEQKIKQAMRRKLNLSQQLLTTKMATLQAISPLATLDRGYALATLQRKVLLDTKQVSLGDIIDVRLGRGTLRCEVLASTSEDS